LLFLNKDYKVEKEVIVNQPIDTVFNYIKHLKNQDDFSVWATRDPNMKKEYIGLDGKVGFISRWESENEEVGVGEQEIIKITEGERVDFELRFFKPFESTENAFMTVEALGDSKTKVIWGFSSRFDYPMNAMLLFIDFEEEIGNDFETGLKKLKQNLE
jgi:uncharacterized protein YndB with AHSA1/START domain